MDEPSHSRGISAKLPGYAFLERGTRTLVRHLISIVNDCKKLFAETTEQFVAR